MHQVLSSWLQSILRMDRRLAKPAQYENIRPSNAGRLVYSCSCHGYQVNLLVNIREFINLTEVMVSGNNIGYRGSVLLDRIGTTKTAHSALITRLTAAHDLFESHSLIRLIVVLFYLKPYVPRAGYLPCSGCLVVCVPLSELSDPSQRFPASSVSSTSNRRTRSTVLEHRARSLAFYPEAGQ